MPIFAASSGIVMPGCPCTKASASAARVPLPLRRPARRRPGGRPGLRLAALALALALVVVLAAVRLTEPRGRPGPRRRLGAALAALAGAASRTPDRAELAASRRLYSSA